MSFKYDVIIIGAGPSGSIFASQLSKRNLNIKIALIDGQTEENKKPCGGLLAPDAQKELAKLNLTLPNYILSDPQKLKEIMSSPQAQELMKKFNKSKPGENSNGSP